MSDPVEVGKLQLNFGKFFDSESLADVRLTVTAPRNFSRAFRTMREKLRVLRYKLTVICVEGVALFAVAIFYMAYAEDWPYLKSAVWATETLTSIGYGDFSPESNGGKLFTIFYAPVSYTHLTLPTIYSV